MKASVTRVIVLLVMVSAAFVGGAYFWSLDPVQDLVQDLTPSDDEPQPSGTISRYMAPTPEVYFQTDVEALIAIKSAEDVKRVRAELINLYWGEPGLPTATPTQVNTDVQDFLTKPEPSVRRVDRLLIEMDFGLDSKAYHLLPTHSNGSVVLFHLGHSEDWLEHMYQLVKLLDQGYAVVILAMPLHAGNRQPTVDLPHVGRLQITAHDQIKYLHPEHGHPVRYFLDPTIITINYLLQKHNYQNVSMMGISGGGWTTTLVAAVDTRISASIPVAGSYPVYLRSGVADDWGDYEQNEPSIYKFANYLELYVMGATGEGRRQLQVLNKYDPCCFATTKSETYQDDVRERVASLGPGEYQLLLDDSHAAHMISDLAMTHILAWIKGEPVNLDAKPGKGDKDIMARAAH